MEARLIDVREYPEFAEGHIERFGTGSAWNTGQGQRRLGPLCAIDARLPQRTAVRKMRGKPWRGEDSPRSKCSTAGVQAWDQ